MSDAFKKGAGYKSLPGMGQKIPEDYHAVREYTDPVFSGSAGFLEGLVMSIGTTIIYPIVGAVGGFKEGGIPGMIYGFFYSIWKVLTYAARNSHRKINNLAEGAPQRPTHFALFREDCRQLWDYEDWTFWTTNGINDAGEVAEQGEIDSLLADGESQEPAPSAPFDDSRHDDEGAPPRPSAPPNPSAPSSLGFKFSDTSL